MPCWRIVATAQAKNNLQTKTPGAGYRETEDEYGNLMLLNSEIRDIIAQLEIKYGYSISDAMVPMPNKQPPFIDATGIKGEIDFVMYKDLAERIAGAEPSVNTFDLYRELLKQNGLELVRSTQVMNVVVICDPVSDSKK